MVIFVVLVIRDKNIVVSFELCFFVGCVRVVVGCVRVAGRRGFIDWG